MNAEDLQEALAGKKTAACQIHDHPLIWVSASTVKFTTDDLAWRGLTTEEVMGRLLESFGIDTFQITLHHQKEGQDKDFIIKTDGTRTQEIVAFVAKEFYESKNWSIV